ncbi:MAG: HTTM domain-containing protein [Bradymonadia bacterium]
MLQTRFNRYFHAHQGSYSRLIALRWAMFGLIAYDMWTIMLPHASRYGAGNFNVAQIAFLDVILPVPTPGVVSVVVMCTGIASALIACGIVNRLTLAFTAVGYFGLYLWSQADSYQHHYLVGLMLCIACFIPVSRWAPRQRDATSNSGDLAMPWALQLIYVQIALVYFWTAVTKLDATWLTGLTMNQITAEPAMRAFMKQIESSLSLEIGGGYRLAALLVVIGEFFAALAFLIPKLRVIGLFIVPWFHIGVELLGVEIELFSYYMVALNLILLTPNTLWTWIDDKWHSKKTLRETRKPALSRAQAYMCMGLTALLSGGLLGQIPLASAPVFATVGAGLCVYGVWSRMNQSILLCSLVCLGVSGTAYGVVKHSESAYDFYRLWGGDLRRRQQLELAVDKYERANRIKTSGPARHLQLGQLYDRLGRNQDAIDSYRAARKQLSDHLSELQRASNRDPTNGQLQIEIAENQLRLRQRCNALAKALRTADLAAERDDAQLCGRNARTGSATAVKKALNLIPMPNLSQRKSIGRIQRQLRKGQRK